MKRLLIFILTVGCLLTSVGLTAFAGESDALKFEGESTPFSVTDDAGKTATVSGESKWAWTLKLNLSGIKGNSGDIAYFRSGGIGGTVDYEIDVPRAGVYDLIWAMRPNSLSYATVQVLLNGVKIGDPVSLKSGDSVNGTVTALNVIHEVNFGEQTFKAGRNTVSFMLLDNGPKDGSLTVDYIRLADPAAEEPEPVQNLKFEAEDLPFTVTDDTGMTTSENKASKWAWSLNLSGVSGVSGRLTYFRSGGLGGTVDFKVNLSEAGRHSIVWAYRPSPLSYGEFQLLVNGEEIGGMISMKSGRMVGGIVNNSSEMVRTVTLGNYDFKKGENVITVKTIGLGSTEADTAFTVDYFELGDPVDESTLAFTTDADFSLPKSKENSAPVTVDVPDGMPDSYPGLKDSPKTTDKITVYPLADCYAPSSNYTVTVDGVNVPVYSVDDDYEYAAFDYDPEKGSVEVTIECKSTVRDLTVSPQHKDPVYSKSGKTIKMTISENQHYALCIGGKYLILSADPMQTDVPAERGEGIFNVTDAPYSVSSGMSDKDVTAAIQKALDDASAYGSNSGNKNGVVYIPAGVYYVGNLVIGSNTYLYLAGGAVLRITDDTDLLTVHGVKTSMTDPLGKNGVDYTWWISTAFEETGVEDVNGSYDIRIGGRGTIDGRDPHYWDKSEEGNHRVGQNTVVPIACSHFTLEGVTIREAVCWSVVAVRSDNMTFTGLKLLNRLVRGHDENDGIDVCECQNVTVKDCIGFAMDDPFSAKTWPYKTGITTNWPGLPEYLDNVTFENCMSYTHRMGFKIGQGTDQNHYNVKFRNCTVIDATIGFGVHCSSGSGVVSGVVFDTIYIEKIHAGGFYSQTGWLFLHVQQNGRGQGNLKDVTVMNIHVYKGAEGNKAIQILGNNAESGIEGVIFTDIYFDGVKAQTIDELKPGLNQNLYAYYVGMRNTDDGIADPGMTDPGTTDPGTTDPGTTDPGTTDPGTTDPGTTDPDYNGDDAEKDRSVVWIVPAVIAAAVAVTVAAVMIIIVKKKKGST